MFFALCAARIPVGVKYLIKPPTEPRMGRDDLDHIEALIKARLQALNVPFEDVTVAPPCPVTAACFVANPAFLQQVSENCHAANAAWQLQSAFVKFPMPGYVEIVGLLESGNEVTLLPAELCCEPRDEVVKTLERVMREAGLPVTSARVSLHSRSANVH